MKKVIRFGSRKSALALAQTRLVMAAVEAAHRDLRAELVPVTTSGDVNMKPFSEASDKSGIKGLFTLELEEALKSGKIDVAVHSLKDLPLCENRELPIVACSKRGDARDTLVLPAGAQPDVRLPIGCSSARRRLQLARLFPSFRVEPVRGNVNTRLRKLDEGAFAALVLAAAGLTRIGMGHRITRYFSADEMTPAPGQGILACQGRAGENYDYLDAVRCEEAALCAAAERCFSSELGGGCASPVGAYAEIKDGKMTLRGFYADEEKNIYEKRSAEGSPREAEALARGLARAVREGKR